MKLRLAPLLALGALGCRENSEILHFPLPDLGNARSIVLLVQDGDSRNPFVVLSDIPFAPLSIEGEDLSLEAAQVEVALFTCPLAGLGLEAGRGRPAPREAEAATLPTPPAVFRTTVSDGLVAEYQRAPPGDRPMRIDERMLDIQPARACPHFEFERIEFPEERGRLVYLGAIAPGRALLQLGDGTLGLVDAAGFQNLEPLVGSMLIGGSARLPDGRWMLVTERGDAAWIGTLEDGFEPAPPLLPGPGTKIQLASPPTPSASTWVSALRYDSLQTFDGTSWSMTATLTMPMAEPTRIPSLRHLSADELLFLHPSTRGVFRLVSGRVHSETVGFEVEGRQASVLGYGAYYGALVGASNTSVYRSLGDGTWVEIAPSLSRGQTRFVLELGRTVVLSDGQGTLQVHDPAFGLACPGVPFSGQSLGFGVPLEPDLWVVGSEWFRTQAIVALVSLSNIVPPCSEPLEL